MRGTGDRSVRADAATQHHEQDARTPAPASQEPDADADVDTSAPLELVTKLCDTLAAEGIHYCHWKSNDVLERSGTAENDLDLLVSRRDAPRFAEILQRLAFKEAAPPAAKRFQSVVSAYGLDGDSGRIVHVDAQYQLVLGDDMTKNYRIPIEEAYLNSAQQGPVFRTPAPEFELVVFIIRMTLKHCTLDAILCGQGSLSEGEWRELSYLWARADLERAQAVVREHLPYVGEDLWVRCAACVRPRSSFQQKVRAAYCLERSLEPFGRRPWAADVQLRTRRRARVVFNRRVLGRRSQRHHLLKGGAVVAFVGADGAGKSTAVGEVSRWLARDFETITVHLGKPPRSRISFLVRAGLALRFGRRTAVGPMKSAPKDTSPSSVRIVLDILPRVLRSRDRYLAYVRARRFAAQGGIAVSDRYPLPQIELMDSPVTSRSDMPGVLGALTRLEHRYYTSMVYPDVLIVLQVSPEIAVERSQDDEAYVRRRSEETLRVDWGQTPAIVVDAARPLSEVLAEIKSAVWSAL